MEYRAKCLSILSKIPPFPIYYLAKLQPREQSWKDQQGKKTLLSLNLVSLCRGAFLALNREASLPDSEIDPLLTLLGKIETFWTYFLPMIPLAWAVHLSNDNEGVIRPTH